MKFVMQEVLTIYRVHVCVIVVVVVVVVVDDCVYEKDTRTTNAQNICCERVA